MPRRGGRLVRLVVCMDLDRTDPMQLSAARLHDPPWINGGVRTLHELAVAAAAAGYECEVRGDFHGGVLAELAGAAGVRVGAPDEPRAATADDIVCVPDGLRDPTFFIRVALLPSRPVYFAMAPPGLFGWSFTPGWHPVDPMEVDPGSVGRPAHCHAIDALGFRVWSNADTTGAAFRDAGVPATVLHEGWPGSLPAAPVKDVDVVTVGDNRWTSLTRAALEGFGGTWRELPMLPNRELIEELGRGRVFVHCARIEGHSRLALEARRMGTCCVGLSSNRFAVGFDEASGGVLVDELQDVVPAVERLLRDPTELAHRQERARRSVEEIVDWDLYVGRVGAALAAIEAEDDPRDAPWRAVADLLATRSPHVPLRVPAT
jgi:hypothetical protein